MGSITGTVTDSSGGAIWGVNVRAMQNGAYVGSTVVATNADGNYTLSNLPAGDYTVMALNSSYELQSLNVTVPADGSVSANFSLSFLDTTKIADQLESDYINFLLSQNPSLSTASQLGTNALTDLVTMDQTTSSASEINSVLTIINNAIGTYASAQAPSNGNDKVLYGMIVEAEQLINVAMSYFTSNSMSSTSLGDCLSAYQAKSNPSLSDALALGTCAVTYMITNQKALAAQKSTLTSIMNALTPWAKPGSNTDMVLFGKVYAPFIVIEMYFNS